MVKESLNQEKNQRKYTKMTKQEIYVNPLQKEDVNKVVDVDRKH